MDFLFRIFLCIVSTKYAQKISRQCLIKVSLHFSVLRSFRFNCLHNKLLFVYLFLQLEIELAAPTIKAHAHSNCIITFFSSSLFFYVKHKQFCLPAYLFKACITGAYRFVVNCCCVQVRMIPPSTYVSSSTSTIIIVITITILLSSALLLLLLLLVAGRTRICILCSF